MNLRFKLGECFEFFSHIFPYWRTFYNSYLSVFTYESFLISIDKLLLKLWYFLANIIWRRHFSRACTKNTLLQHSNINLHSNLRLMHYLHYKVRGKGTNKSYKTCYFGLRMPYMQSFLWLYKNTSLNFFCRDVMDFNQVPPTPLIQYHGESRTMCRPTYTQGVT